MDKKKKKITAKQRLLLTSLFLLGSACLSLTMVRSGLLYDFGLGFWGPNGHDGIWHLSLINQVAKSFPPNNPVFAGEKLTNYHYFFDLLLAFLGRITFLSPRVLYFQIFPIISSVLIGVLSFLVGYYWKKDFWVGFWLAFFNYFAGSFGFLVTLAKEGRVGGESLFWSMQSISALINPPFALSLVLLLLAMFFLLRIKKWSWKKIFGVGIIFSILINVKAYGGLVGLVALGAFALKRLLEQKKEIFFVFLFAVFFSLLIFITTNRSGASIFVFNPLWFVHAMIESQDRFYLPRVALARYFLADHGIGPRLILIELFGVFVFLVGNLGTRILGVFGWKKSGEFSWFLLAGAAAGLLPPFLFTQKGTAWNTIQFFYYFLFFANFFTAAAMARVKNVFLLFIIVLLTIPTTWSTLRDYFGYPPPATLPTYEFEALSFLQKQADGVVLTYPYDKYKKAGVATPLPLYLYETTAYVSAFSGKISFLEDEINLEITGYPWQERKSQIEDFFVSVDKIKGRGFLLNNKIDYVYLVNDQKLPTEAVDLGLKVIFDNGQVKIYQTQK